VRGWLSRIYYGWYVLVVAALAGGVSAGSSQMFMGSIMLVITQATGWSHTDISTTLLLGTVCGGALSALAGLLTDRHGPRALMTAAVRSCSGVHANGF